MLSIDLNCDMGESFGAWTFGNDVELIKCVSSVNVACGFHAGDATTIRRTIETALKNDVAVGAHPSFPDLQGFGRRAMSLSPLEIFDVVLYQTAALKGICEAHGAKMRHVKPHGALYNCAAQQPEIAAAIAEAVRALDKNLILFGLSGSHSISEAEKLNLTTASEVFADRTYQKNGSLTDRKTPGALIENADQAVAQVLQMINNQTVKTLDGAVIPITAETICIHGDERNAVEFARAIHAALAANKIKIAALTF